MIRLRSLFLTLPVVVFDVAGREGHRMKRRELMLLLGGAITRYKVASQGSRKLLAGRRFGSALDRVGYVV